MASEKLEMEIVGKNATTKGWDKVEAEAKSRAKKIRDALKADGGIMGDAHGGGHGGVIQNLRHGFEKGEKGGLGSLLPGGLGNLGAIAAVGAGIGVAVGAIHKLWESANEYSESMMKISENTGIGMKSAQNLVFAGKAFDVSAEDIQISLGRIAKAQSEAFADESTQKALKNLNIPISDFVNMKPDEAFQRLGKALKDTGDRADVMAIVGRGGLKQMGFMKEIAGGIEDVGLASDQNIEKVHSFGTAIEKLIMKFKAGAVNKIGQLMRGDMDAFTGVGPEQEKKKTNLEELKDQNEKIKEDEQAKYKASLSEENAKLKEEMDGRKRELQQSEVDTRNFEQAKEHMGSKTDYFERMAGRSDLDAQGNVDRETRMALDGRYRRSEGKTDRQIERERKRAAMLLDQAGKAHLDGTLSNNPRLKKIFEADQKRIALEDIKDNLKQRQLAAAEAQIKMQADTEKIKDNTAEIATLKTFLAMK